MRHCSGRNRWEYSLAAGRWRPVSALPRYSMVGRFPVNRWARATPMARLLMIMIAPLEWRAPSEKLYVGRPAAICMSCASATEVERSSWPLMPTDASVCEIVPWAFSTGNGDDGHARDVVAAIDAVALPAHRLDFLEPRLVARRIVPAQRLEALLDLGRRVIAEGREAAAGGADQGGEAAADIDVQPHRRLAARERDHDHVPEIGQLDADRGDADSAATDRRGAAAPGSGSRRFRARCAPARSGPSPGCTAW